jgi:hypothetical protein
MYGTSCTPPRPISITCFKWYTRKAPFVLSAQSAELLLACLINLLPESFGTLSVSGSSCNISGGSSGIWRLMFSRLCLWLSISGPLGRLPLPGTTGLCCSEGREPLPASQGGEFQLHKETWKGLGTNLGAPLIILVRTQVQIQACLRRQKGSLINSQKAPK